MKTQWVDEHGAPIDTQAIFAAWPAGVTSQQGEGEVLLELSQLINCDKSFIEFGFEEFSRIVPKIQ